MLFVCVLLDKSGFENGINMLLKLCLWYYNRRELKYCINQIAIINHQCIMPIA